MASEVYKHWLKWSKDKNNAQIKLFTNRYGARLNSMDNFPVEVYADTLSSYAKEKGWDLGLISSTKDTEMPPMSVEDYKWATKQAFNPDNKLYTTAGHWHRILRFQWYRLWSLKTSEFKQEHLNWFLLWFKYPQEVILANGKKLGKGNGLAHKDTQIGNRELQAKYLDLVITKGDTGITKFIGKLSPLQFQKDIKTQVETKLKSGVEIVAPALIMGPKELFTPPTYKTKESAYSLQTINTQFSSKARSWFNEYSQKVKSAFASRFSLNTNFESVVDQRVNAMKPNDITIRKWATKPEPKPAVIPSRFKAAITAGLATKPGLAAFFVEEQAGGDTSKFKFTWKVQEGLKGVTDLRDLPETKGISKDLFDGIELEINGKYLKFLDTLDWGTLLNKEKLAKGEQLDYGGDTQMQKYTGVIEDAADIVAKLYASARQRVLLEEFIKDLSTDATAAEKAAKAKDPNASLTAEQISALGAASMTDAQAASDKRLADGIASASKASNRVNEMPPEADKLTEDEINEKRKYVKQCALILNFSDLKMKYEEKRLDDRKAKRGAHKTAWFDNRFIMVDTNKLRRRDILNQLFVPKMEDIEPFMKLTPDLVSALTPKIRLFKIWNQGCDLYQQEIAFPNFEDPSRISALRNLKAGIDRGNGSGIKSLNWTYEGTNPAEARSAIGMELTLFFQSFEEIIKKRDNGSSEYRYVDLLLHPENTKTKTKKDQGSFNPYAQQNSENYRVRVDVGWQNITGKVRELFNRRGDLGITADNVNDAINRINKSFYLTLVDHEMDIKENGNIEIKASYRAYTETALQDKHIDALASPMIIGHRAQFGAELQKLINDGDCSVDQYKELRATYAAIDDEFRIAAYRSIMKRMMMRGHVHFCKINRNQIGGGFKLKGGKVFEGAPKLEWPNNKGTYGDAKLKDHTSGKSKTPPPKKEAVEKVESAEKVKKAADAAKKTLTKPEEKDLKSTRTFEQLPSLKDAEDTVSFFFLGDLIHTVLDAMHYPKNRVTDKVDPQAFENFDSKSNQEVGERICHLKNINILLPSFDYIEKKPKARSAVIPMNVAEIPVAVDYFLEFMTQQVIKGERKSYPVMDMIRDLTRNLVVDVLSEKCHDLKDVKKTDFSHTAFVGSGNNGGDPLRSLRSGKDGIIYTDKHFKKGGGLPIKAVESNMHSKDFQQYLVLYPKQGTDKYNGSGNLKEDAKAGVYHYEIGARAGLLKKIKFTKTDMVYLRESRFIEQGNDGLLQLGAVYQASIDMIGNTLYFPGMNLWIEPTSLGTGHEMDPRRPGSAANKLGFGGYHQIIRVSCEITPGKFSTNVKALFTYSGDGGKGYSGKKKPAVKPKVKEPDKSAKSGASKLGTKPSGEKQTSAEKTYCNVFINHRQQQLQGLFAEQSAGLKTIGLSGPAPTVVNFGGAVGASAGVPSVSETASKAAKEKLPNENMEKDSKKVDPEKESPWGWVAESAEHGRWVKIGWRSGGMTYDEQGNPLEIVNPAPPFAEASRPDAFDTSDEESDKDAIKRLEEETKEPESSGISLTFSQEPGRGLFDTWSSDE